MADRLTLYQPGGVDYTPHLGVSPHLFGTLLQPCNVATGRSNSFCSIVYKSVDSLEAAVTAEHTISNKRVFVEKAPVFGLRHSGARNSENLFAPVDTSLEIIGVVKPRHERTWEIIDLSLEEIEAGSDDQNHLSDTSF